jgi:hypothetical protein
VSGPAPREIRIYDDSGADVTSKFTAVDIQLRPFEPAIGTFKTFVEVDLVVEKEEEHGPRPE